jgi:hypothetical protein
MLRLLALLTAAAGILSPHLPQTYISGLSQIHPESPRVVLDVPMVYQAPFGIWDRIHEDTCEEASALMVKTYLEKKSELTPAEMDSELLKMVDYENETFGRFESTSIREVAQMLRDVYGIETEMVAVESARDIRREIIAGRPVIVPAAGKLLGNPHFRGGGPVYHMFVIKGFEGDDFITNEPGTRHGLDLRYSRDTVMKALHDYNNYDVMTGKKVVLVPKVE